MSFEYFIARRIALGNKRSVAHWIIRIAVVAVALSVAVMIVTNALITGFKQEIKTKIFGFWGHIHITKTEINHSLLDPLPVSKNQDFYPALDTIRKVTYYKPLQIGPWSFEDRMVERRTNGGVRHMQVFALEPGIIKTKDDIEGIILKGVDEDFDWTFFQRYLEEGTIPTFPDTAFSRDILVSRPTADRLRLSVGDQFIVYFVENGDQLLRRFKVCGIYKTGLGEYDQKFALVDIRQVRQVLGWEEDMVGGFEVIIDDIEDLDMITDYIYFEALPNDMYAESIRDKFPPIFDWLELQNINEVVILALMTIVSIINMITALIILILERTTMIGVLKSMGSNNWSIRRIFLYHAAYITLQGLFWGNLIGLALCFLQKRFHLIKLSEADYYISEAPIALDPWQILLINLGTLAITLLFLILPSYMVTSISPVKAIRFK